MEMSTQNENEQNIAKIIGIQFSILSPEEIRKGSVAEITNRDTYINNKPVIGGLFDPRMGVLEPGLICPTDGHDYMKTPGYFGHIDLAKPVFYIQYLPTIIKILRCCCIKCSKLLISKDKYKEFLDLNPDERWNQVFQHASKIKRCGEATDDGCGCKQPNKIKKENLATLIAEWDDIETSEGSDETSKISIKLTPEKVIKLFRRISDDNVSFMGFSPIWSRPEWMVCQTLAIPPPAVRPSVKHDSQQRSEDDITHIIVNIIKANKTLQEKIANNANGNVIDDWATVLQYYIATLVDNKIPGVAAVAQRSGRPLKSIKERLNGKAGRVRGNLMGKRVDYSARSVITPDPQLSIRELGIPLKIAKNLTKPVTVNDNNKKFLLKLVRNGPDEYPGAKILERKTGENISLRYIDRESIKLQNGDKVHRHMMDGDGVLFNRQPTLHRLSMMCHIVKILYQGDTFRMNVGDTKPYNADFDGDEMNLHMPQDEEAEIELLNLAAIPTQIVSPANNKSIIGIFQDSLLGCYQFSRQLIDFTPRKAMNLLMGVNNIDISRLQNLSETISNFELLSQIIPPITLKYKSKKFKDSEDYNTSNNVIEIINGTYFRGQLEKGVLGDGSKGLIQRIYNDFGQRASADFIDNLQSIITEFMKSDAYSVGISDLIADDATNESIIKVITSKKAAVQNIIDQTHLGIFENKSGKTNDMAFEEQVNNILNQATNEAGQIGRSSLDRDNRFVIMVNAGSKGSDLNIAQMISALGQQNVDGKRIPYGFENRTLPHYTKYDDSPGARGFIESSFIGGLTPTELFFHAMGGRVGLIDTAVKTSQTGYISRRLIKALEDLMVRYDMTVRNNKDKIIQFSYGDDGFDPVRVESQVLPLVQMSKEEIYNYFHISVNKRDDINSIFNGSAGKLYKQQVTQLNEKMNSYIEYMKESQVDIIENVFKNLYNKQVHLPIAFTHIISNVQGQENLNADSTIDITPLEAFTLIEDTYKLLNNLTYSKPNKLFTVLYYFYLSPKQLLIIKRFNKSALTYLLDTIVRMYKEAIVNPGEMVGVIAAQSIGEPTTQLTLNTFHFAGVASKSNVTRGVPRIEEILSLSENPKNPSCTVYLPKEIEHDKDAALQMVNKLEHTKLRHIVKNVAICYDPDDLNTLIKTDQDIISQYQEFSEVLNQCLEEPGESDDNKSNWIIRIEMNKVEMLDKNISMDDINFALTYAYGNTINCVYSDYNADDLIFRIRLKNIMNNSKKKPNQVHSLDQSDEIYVLKNFQDELLNNLILRGIKNISAVIPRKITDSLEEDNGTYNRKEIWVLDTVGTNLLELLSFDEFDSTKTYTNDIQEVYRVLGIEAARQIIYNEFTEVIEHDGAYINYHHLSLLCDRMTVNKNLVSVFRHGINNDDIGPIAKASFEETPEQFLKAARHGELDNLRGVSANVMCGQDGYFGTSAFSVLLDVNKTLTLAEQQVDILNSEEYIEKEFQGIMDPNDPCSLNNISLQTNVKNIKQVDLGEDNDYDPFA
jgi:DNA-directed RNA polymerase II subunit RPB1